MDARAERAVNVRSFCTRETLSRSGGRSLQNAGAGSKSARVQNYRDAMAAAYAWTVVRLNTSFTREGFGKAWVPPTINFAVES